MKNLAQQLNSYRQKDYYPFHMPGHKRNPFSVEYKPSLETDITEIDGFDDLHHAEGILREAEERACALYKSGRTWYSVNGSTAALLAAIFSCTSAGGKILVARNCHRSVYHAIALRRIDAVYVYPETEPVFCLNGGISPEAVKKILDEERDVQAVLITSPTYDGVVSDVAAISDICHAAGIPLIVDEAHGAHFPFHQSFPKSALKMEADLVAQSLHKTLPSMTQTALLHKNSDRVPERLIDCYMRVFQTSSPSYPLMASIDSCICLLENKGEELFEQYVKLLTGFYEEIRSCGKIRAADRSIVGTAAIYDWDFSKILLTAGVGTGGWLYDRLLSEFHLQMEMKAPDYVLGITGIADRPEGFHRLAEAVRILDKAFSPDVIHRFSHNRENLGKTQRYRADIPIGQAMDARQRKVTLGESAGYVCGDFIYLYPPGIPLIVPGERMSAELAEYIDECQRQGFEVRGVGSDGTVGVVYE